MPNNSRSVESAVAFHDRLAESWDAKYQKQSFRAREKVVCSLLSSNVKPMSTWLDAGCGSGRFTCQISELGASAIGMDAAPRMIEKARDLASPMGIKAPDFRVVASISSTGMPDRALDGILCNSVIEYLDDVPATLAEFLRVLKPDGVLLVSAANRFSLLRQALKLCFRITSLVGGSRFQWLEHSKHDYSVKAFRRLLESAGFSVQSQVTFGGTLPCALARFPLFGPLTFYVARRRDSCAVSSGPGTRFSLGR